MDGLTHAHHDIALGPATREAVDEVLALTRSCVDHMTGCGILQWDDLYPDRDSVECDICNEAALLACHNGEVVAYFALDSRQDPQYAQVDWRFDTAPIAVVHRLMVAPAWQGRGLGRWCMDIAEQMAAQSGYATMRLEAFTANPRAIQLYRRCGYRAAGVVHFRTGEFTCFEKTLVAARMGERVDLRTYRDSDDSAVHDLIHRTIDACYPTAYTPQAVAFFKRFHSVSAIRERAQAGYVVIGEREGQVVATGALVGDEITGVFVEPALQGCGLGASVMDKLESLAADCGHATAHLSVSRPSRGFYERRGYRVLEERSIDVGSGERLAYWDAEKPLPRES